MAIIFGDPPEAPPGTRILPEDLVGLIEQNIAEDSWANDRNSIEVRGNELVIVQAPEVQEDIARFLAALRARRARMFVIDVALVPAELIEAEPPPWLDAGALERFAEVAGTKGERVSLVASNEQTASIFKGRLRTNSCDQEVNATGVIPVSNPVVVTLPLGLTVEAEPLSVMAGDLVRLRLSVSRLEEAGPATKRETLFAEIEIVPLREASIETVLLLRPGRTTLAGIVEDLDGATGVEGSSSRRLAVLVRARKTDLQAEVPARPADPEEFRLRTYDIALAFDPLLGSPLLSTGVLLDLLRSGVDPEAWKDQRAWVDISAERSLRVVAREGTHLAVSKWVQDLIAKRARMATLEVQAFEGPADAMLRLKESAGGELELPDGWEATTDGKALRRKVRAVLAGALGSILRAKGFDARNYVQDVTSVCGGTGFATVVVPDADVESAGNGFRLEARSRGLLAPGRFAIELALHQARTAFERKATILMPTALGPTQAPTVPFVPAGVDGAPVPAPPRHSMVLLPCQIDLPDQERISLATSATVRAGRTAILQISPAEAGRCVLVTARLVVEEEGREP